MQWVHQAQLPAKADATTIEAQFSQACQQAIVQLVQRQPRPASPPLSGFRYGLTKEDLLRIWGENPVVTTGEEPRVYWWFYNRQRKDDIYYHGFLLQQGIYVDTLTLPYSALLKHPEHGPAIKRQWAVNPQQQRRDLAAARRQFTTKLWWHGPAPDEYKPTPPPQGVLEVQYPSGPLQLKAWVSEDPRDGKRHPAVVFLHGGHALAPIDWYYAAPLVEAGFVLLMPMLRGENGNPGSYEGYYGEVDDALAAGRFVASLPYVDASHIFVAGHSTGATLTVLTTMMPSVYKAGAAFDGYLHMPSYDYSPRLFNPEDPEEMHVRNPMAFVPSVRIPLALFTTYRSRADAKRFLLIANQYDKPCQLITVPGDHEAMLSPAVAISIPWFRQRIAQVPRADAPSQSQKLLSQSNVYEHLKLFTEVLTYIETNYIGEIDPKDVIYAAIQGMLKRGDPDGSFIPPDVYQEMQAGTEGRFAGVGLEMTIREDNLLVVAPVEDTPAFRGGIQPEDHIVKIDGVSTKGMTLSEAVRKLRGPEGAPVTLSILRKGVAEPKDWTLTREFTVIRSVSWNRLQNNIAYIRLRNFQKTTSDELEEALQELGEESLRGLVLDLRNNPGGLLEQVLVVADKFLKGGQLIVYTQGRLANQNMKGFAKSKKGYRDYPMLVLVNKGSAGGAEILAGALQDLGRALILGTPTFGQGTIQTIIPLSNGAALRLTTARYFTPKGHAIHGRGIIPDILDITVELPKPQSVTGGKEASGVTVPPTRSRFGDLTTDRQLQRAVEILRAKK
jgi:carboxyl-terminal processing protease